MTCSRCSREIDQDSAFCRFCGTAAHEAARSRSRGRLVRLPDTGHVAGVCSGIAAYLGADVTLIRLAWVILSVFPGAVVGGLLAYAGAWFLMPIGRPDEHPPYGGRPLRRSTADRKVGGVCGGLAEYFGVDATLVRVVVVVLSIYPGAVICGVLAYAIAWVIIPSARSTPLEPAASAL